PLPCWSCPLPPPRLHSPALSSSHWPVFLRAPPSFPTRRSSDLRGRSDARADSQCPGGARSGLLAQPHRRVRRLVRHVPAQPERRSEEHTSELQSRFDLVCRLLLEKKNEGETPRGRRRRPGPACQ